MGRKRRLPINVRNPLASTKLFTPVCVTSIPLRLQTTPRGSFLKHLKVSLRVQIVSLALKGSWSKQTNPHCEWDRITVKKHIPTDPLPLACTYPLLKLVRVHLLQGALGRPLQPCPRALIPPLTLHPPCISLMKLDMASPYIWGKLGQYLPS